MHYASNIDVHRTPLKEPAIFGTLRHTWKKRLEPLTGDKPIKIAVLDTGIDMMHKDFKRTRAVHFENGQPQPDPTGTPQLDRIKGKRNFCNNDDADIQDRDGHGTAVAGIILRLTPDAHLFIARICVGDANYGVSADKQRSIDESQTVKPRPDTIKEVRLH